MKHPLRALVFLLALLPAVVQAEPRIDYAFSPDQGATDMIVRAIAESRDSVRVAAYSFTSRAIAEALIEAKRRGVDVRVVIDADKAVDQHSVIHMMKARNVEVRANGRYKIMHNKFMVIDGVTLQLGSFNYTRAAEQDNAENIVVIHDDTRLAQAYGKEWKKLWDEAR